MQLDSRTTALVTIDLQNGIVARTLEPHSAAEVMERSARLAEAFRAKGAPVVYVNVNVADFLELPTDTPRPDSSTPPPPSASELAPASGYREGDLRVTKRQWGAFGSTNLAEMLRERNVDTIVLTGVATNFGVESTAREATGLGFAVVTVEDACSTIDAELHKFPFENIFPRLGRVRSTEQVVNALE